MRIKEMGHFDHRILSMVFVVDSSGSQHADTELNNQYIGHQADSCASNLRLNWRPDKAIEHPLHIQQNHEMKDLFDAAAERGEVEGAYNCVKQFVLQAASDPRVGMTSYYNCGNVRNNRKGMKRPIWFDWECQCRRQAFNAAVHNDEARHACRELHKANRSHARWVKRRFTSFQRALFLARLSRNDAATHTMLKKAKGAQRTPITTAAWEHYLRGHFLMAPQQHQQHQERPGRSDISAKDTTVPLGRNHPPQKCSSARVNDLGGCSNLIISMCLVCMT